MATREDQEYSSQAPAPYIGQFLQQGIFPYAQQFLQQQFDQMGQADSSPFTYTGQRVAGFDPRERYGMELADSAIGSYRPYLGQQAGLLDEAAGMERAGLRRGQAEINQGITEGRGLSSLGAGLTQNALFDTAGRDMLAGAQQDQSGRRLIEGAQFGESGRGYLQGGVPDYSRAQQGLGRAEQTGYGSTTGFDPRGVSNFYNPFEDQVVQQTMKDVREGLAKGDMGMRDEAVSGGAFGGSRSRMRRGELAEDAARGAAEQVGAIRSGGYQDAASRAQQAFEAQQGRQQSFASQQAGLAGQRGGFEAAQAQAKLATGQALNASEEAAIQNQITRGTGLNTLDQQRFTNQLQQGQGLSALDQQRFANQLQQGQQLGAAGQQQLGMGLAGGQGLAGLGSKTAGALSGMGAQYGGMASLLPQLQQQDIQSQMGMGGLGRGREQSLMDLNYQNYTGQYNLPMQTLQNVGALTASLGPMAGGFGYAGGAPTSNTNYTPQGPIGGGVTPGTYSGYGGFGGFGGFGGYGGGIAGLNVSRVPPGVNEQGGAAPTSQGFAAGSGVPGSVANNNAGTHMYDGLYEIKG